MFPGRADSSRYRPRGLSPSATDPSSSTSATAQPEASKRALPAPRLSPPSQTRSSLNPQASTLPVALPVSLRSRTLTSIPESQSGQQRNPQAVRSVLRSGTTTRSLRPAESFPRSHDQEYDSDNQDEPPLDGGGYVDTHGIIEGDVHDDAASSACSTAFTSGENHIITAVRVRPMFASERKAGCRRIIDMGVQTSSTGNWTRIVNPVSLSASPQSAESSESQSMSRHATQFTHDFNFDYSFWSYDRSPGRKFATQSTIYEELGVFAIDSAWQGYNCSIFAYGQTSAGKTFTMTGDTIESRTGTVTAALASSPEVPVGSHPRQGITPRICRGLFDKIEQARAAAEAAGHNSRFSVQVSYVEVYHERVYDLLAGVPPTAAAKESLKVRENPEEGVFVEKATTRTVSRFEDIKALIDEGNRVRSVAATNVNQRSSRSHAILTLYVKQHSPSVRLSAATLANTSWMTDKPHAAAENSSCLTVFAKKSKICLVDLAGSERADTSGATGQRLKEAGSINRSLSTLADVISTLSKRSAPSAAGSGSSGHSAFVPYRNSVLTRLLKESLGGNAKTVMLAAISPCCTHYEETLSTLKYIERAKSVVNSVKVNTENSLELVHELRREIRELKAKLSVNGSSIPPTVSPASEFPRHQVVDRVLECDIEDSGREIVEKTQVPLPQLDFAGPGLQKQLEPESGDGGSPQYPAITFTEAEKAKMEREIAKLKIQLKKKDKELLLQQQQHTEALQAAENQRLEAQEEASSARLRRQTLLLNLVGTHKRLVWQRQVQAFERWRAQATIAARSPRMNAKTLEDLASTHAGLEQQRSLLKRAASRPQRMAIQDLCASVVGEMLFTETAPLKSHVDEELHTLELLANDGSVVSQFDEDVAMLSHVLDISLSPSPDKAGVSRRRRSSGSRASLALDLSDSDEIIEIDRLLQESIDDAAAAVEQFEAREQSRRLADNEPQQLAIEKELLASTVATFKDQVEMRFSRCLDVIDLARKQQGPTERRLRKKQEESSAGGGNRSSTSTERQLLKYTDKYLVAVIQCLREFKTSVSNWTGYKAGRVTATDLEPVLQQRLALYERFEAICTVLSLHVLRRLCDQLCEPVTLSMISEKMSDQLSSFQAQLLMPEMWRDLLVLPLEGLPDQLIAVALVRLFGLVERIKASWTAIDQRHHLRELHVRAQQHIVVTSTDTIAKLTAHCMDLEARLHSITQRLEDQQLRNSKSDSELNAMIQLAQAREEEFESQIKALTVQLSSAACSSARVDELLAEKAFMSQELHELKTHCTKLQQQLNQALADSQQQAHHLDSVQKLHSEQETQCQRLHEQLSATTLTLTSAKTRVQDVEGQLSSVTTQLETMTQQWQQSERDRVLAVESSQRLRDEKASAEEQATRLDAAKTSLSEQVAGLAAEKTSLSEQVASLATEKTRLSDQLASLVSQLSETETRERLAQGEIGRVRDELTLAEGRVSEAESQLSEAESKLSEAESKLSEAESKLSEAESKLSEAESKLVSVSALASASEASRTEVSVRLEGELSAALSRCASAAGRVPELEVTVRELEEQHASAQSELLVSSSRVQDVEGQLSSVTTQLETMTQQWQQSERDRVLAVESSQRLRDEKASAEEQATRLDAAKTSLSEQVAGLAAEKTSLSEQVASLATEKTRLSDQLASLVSQLSETETRERLAQGEIGRVRDELTLAEGRVSEAESQLSEAESKLSEAESKLSEAESKLSEAESKLSEAESKLVSVSALASASEASRTEVSVRLEGELSAALSRCASAAGRVSELEVTVRELEEQHASAQSELLVSSSRVQDVEGQLSSVTTQLETMTQQWQQSERDRVLAVESSQRLRDEKASAEEQATRLDAAKTSLSEQVAGLAAEKTSLSEQVASLATEKTRLSDQLASLVSQLSETETRERLAQGEIGRVRDELTLAEGRVSEAESQLSEAESKLSEAESKLSEAESKLSEAESKLVSVSALASASEASRTEVSVRLEGELSAALSRCASAAGRVSELEVTVRELEEQHASAQSELLVSSSRVQDVEGQLSSVTTQLETMTQQWQQSERDRVLAVESSQRLRDEKASAEEQATRLDAAKTSLSEQVAGLAAEKTSLSEQVASLATEKTRLSDQLASLVSQLSETETRERLAQGEIGRVRDELTLAEGRVSEAESQLSETESKLSEAESKLSEAESKLSEAESKLVSVSALASASEASRTEVSVRLEGELSAALSRCASAAGRVSELEVTVRELEEQHASAQSELLVSSSRVQDVEGQLSSVTTQLETMTQQWQQSERDRVLAVESSQRLRDEKASAEEQATRLDAAKTSLSEQVAGLAAEKTSLSEQVASLATEKTRLSDQLASLVSQLSETETRERLAQGEIGRVRDELTLAEGRVSEAESQLSEAESKLSEAESKLSEAESKLSEAESKLVSVSALASASEASRTEVSVRLEGELSAALSRCASAAGRVSELEVTVRELEEQHASAQSELLVSSSRVQDVEGQLSSVTTQLETMTQQWQQSERDRVLAVESSQRLRDEKASAEEQATRLDAAKTSLSEQVAGLAAEKTSLSEQVASLATEKTRLSDQLASLVSQLSETETRERLAQGEIGRVRDELTLAEGRVSEAESQLSEAESKLSEAESKLSEAESKLSEAESKLSEAESKLVSVSALASASEASRTEVSVRLEGELSAALSRCASAAGRVSELEVTVRELEEQHASAQSELLVSSSRVQDVEGQLSSVTTQLETMTQQWQQSERDRVLAVESSQRLRDEKASAEEQATRLDAAKTSLSEQVAGLAAEKTSLSEQVASLATEKTRLSDQLASLVSQLSETETRERLAQGEIGRVRDELTLAEGRVSEAESQLSEAESKLSEAESKLSEAESKLSEAESKLVSVSALASASEASRTEVSVRLEGELSAALSRCASAAGRVSELEVTVRELEEQHASAQSELLVSSSRVQDVEGQLSSVTTQLETMTQQWQQSERDRVLAVESSQRLRDEKASAEEQATRLDAAKTSLSEQVAGLAAEKTSLSEQVASLATEKTRLSDQLASLVSQLSETETRERLAQGEIGRVRDELTLAEGRVSEAESQLSEAESKLSEAESKLSEAESKLSEAESKLVSVSALASASEASRTEVSVRLEGELSAALSRCASAAGRVSELEVTVRELEEQHASAQSELLVSSSRVQDVEGQLSSVTTQLETMTQQWQQSERDRVLAVESSQRLRDEKASAEEQATRLDAAKTSLSEQVAGLAAEKTSLSEQVASLATEKTRLSDQLASLVSQLSETETRERLAQGEIGRVRDELTLAEGRVSEAESQLSEAESKLSEAESKLSEAESKLSEAESKLSEAESKLVSVSALASASEASRTEVSVRLEGELSAALSRCASAAGRVSELEVTVRELEEQHASAQSELLVSSSRVQDVEGQLSSVTTQLETMTQQWQQSERDRVLAVESSQRLRDEKASAEEQATRLDAAKTSLSEQVAGLAAEKTSLSEQVASLATEKTRLSDQLASLVSQLSETETRERLAQGEIGRVRDELTLAEGRVSEAESQLSEAESKLSEAESKLSEAESKLSEAESKLVSVSALASASEASRTEVSVRLEGELSAALSRCASAAGRVSELEVTVRELEEENEALQTKLMLADGHTTAIQTRKTVIDCFADDYELMLTVTKDNQREREAQIEILEEERREAQQALEVAEERYRSLASEFWSQGLQLAKLEEDIARSKTSELHATTELARREEAFAMLIVERTLDFTKHNAEVCCLHDDLRAARSQIQHLTLEIVTMTTQHVVDHTVAETLEKEMKHVSEQLEEWSSKFAALAAAYATQTSALTDSEATVHELQQSMRSLELRVAQLQDGHATVVEQANDEVERLEGNLRDAQSRYNSLRSVYGDAEASVDWEEKYNGLMSDMHVRIQELQEQLEHTAAQASHWEDRTRSQTMADTTRMLVVQVELDACQEQVALLKTQLEKEQSRSEMLSREVESKAADLQELAQAVAHAQGQQTTPNRDEESTAEETRQAAAHQAQRLVLKHLNSLDAWFSRAILQQEPSFKAKVEERRLGSIVEAPSSGVMSDDEEEEEEVWSVVCSPNKWFDKNPDPLTKKKPIEHVDASTSTDSAVAEEAPRPKSVFAAVLGSPPISPPPPPSELAQLRATITKLKGTIDEKEELIRFMDERLSYFESLRFRK